jgi:subtilisin family serine protease
MLVSTIGIRSSSADAPPTSLDPVLVRFRSNAALGAAVADMHRRGEAPLDITDGAVPVISLRAGSPELSRLDRSTGVMGIEVAHEYTMSSVDWGLDRLDQRGSLDGVYSPGVTGAGVTAYVIDSGLRATHAEFVGRVPRYWNYDGAVGTSDCAGHGTHVAGSLGGATFGVAPAVTLVPVKVFPCVGSASELDVINGINWVIADHVAGPAVANMSFGGPVSAMLDAAVNSLIADGVTVAVAAGNSNVNSCTTSPADVPAAITVAASDSGDLRASFSNFGTCNDLFAPGVSINSAGITNDTASALMSGTSMATPHVAGAAALYLQSNPSASPATVSAAILGAATSGIPAIVGVGDPHRLLYVGRHQVTAAVSGDGTITSPGGISCPAKCSAQLSFGTSATLTATSGNGSVFGGWSGACTGLGTCTVVADSVKAVSASFGLTTQTLSVVTAGDGRVTSSPGSIDCPGSCSTSAPYGTQFTLTATPAPGSRFAGWTGGGCTGTSPCTVALTSSPSLTASFSVDPFRPFDEPKRLLDTRPELKGVLEPVDETVRFGPGEVRRYVAGPTLGLPTGAALAINAVAVAPVGNGYLQVFACASITTPPPSGSFLNYTSGTTIANNGTVTIDAGGAFCVLSSQSADIILDSTGFLQVGSLNALDAPARLVDSRPGQLGALEQPGGSIGSDLTAPLSPGVPVRFVLAGAAGIPASAAALALNIVAVAPAGTGYLTAYPCDSATVSPPASSTLNYRAGGAIANGAIVATSADGGLCVVSSQRTNVIIDTTGHFPSGRFAPLAAPARLVDSRPGQLGALEQSGGSVGGDLGVPLTPGAPLRFVVTGANGIPSTVTGIALNVVAVAPTGGGYLSIYQCTDAAAPQPVVSTLNFRGGVTVANGVVVAPTADGGICVVASQTAHFIIDTTGYFPV